MGNASSHVLFDKIKVTRKEAVDGADQFSDYTIEVGEMPPGVTLIERV